MHGSCSVTSVIFIGVEGDRISTLSAVHLAQVQLVTPSREHFNQHRTNKTIVSSALAVSISPTTWRMGTRTLMRRRVVVRCDVTEVSFNSSSREERGEPH